MKKMAEVKKLRIGKETLLRLGTREKTQVAGGLSVATACFCTTQFLHVVKTEVIHI